MTWLVTLPLDFIPFSDHFLYPYHLASKITHSGIDLKPKLRKLFCSILYSSNQTIIHKSEPYV